MHRKNLSKAFVRDLVKSGIHFRWFAPIFKGKKFYLGRRLHHKVVVTDLYHSMVAGLNISDRYNDTIKGQAWLDWALFVRRTNRRRACRTCIRRYKAKLPHSINETPTGVHLKGLVKNCLVRARSNDWIGRKKEISNSYLEMFKNRSMIS
ncbi:MAG: hypothetical protein WDN75_17115 [Bacteroidota bacterium]